VLEIGVGELSLLSPAKLQEAITPSLIKCSRFWGADV
jgi:hypothetical protein